ncbi:MAG: phage tail protein [Firmicutes bacterium]|nr:phage tail protein [Bacillota bacterium]
MQNIRNFDLLSLVPPSIKNDSQVIAACSALESEIQAVSIAIDDLFIIAKLSSQPEAVIDHLAWQWHADFYEDTSDLATKRSLVQNAINWHRKKGTAAVVQEYVTTVLSDGVVSEWFDYNGEPYYFKVSTDEVLSSSTVYDKLVEIINAVKNARSWLEGIIINRSWTGTTYFGGALSLGRTITLKPVAYGMSAVSAPVYYGGAIHMGKRLTLTED